MRTHAGNKARTSYGGLVVVVIMGLLGLKGFYWVYSDTALIIDSRDWVSGDAIVDASWLDKTFSRSSPNYSLMMNYHFSVAGIPYSGNRFEIPSHRAGGDEANFRRQLAPYAPGSVIRIYYDPKDPTRSVVRRPSMDYWFIVSIGGVSLFLLGASLLIANGFVQKRTRARRRARHAALAAKSADTTVKPAAESRLGHIEAEVPEVTPPPGNPSP
jgi:hypothetical protein